MFTLHLKVDKALGAIRLIFCDRMCYYDTEEACPMQALSAWGEGIL